MRILPLPLNAMEWATTNMETDPCSFKTPTYKVWSGMKQRCLNPSNPRWDSYGGVGIKVDPRWLVFENFLEDMGEKPEGKTLDRFPDPFGNYTKSNCRWATPS